MHVEMQVSGGEEVEVVDKLAQACGSIAETVVEVTPCAEIGVALVEVKVFRYAACHIGIVCIGHGQNLLGGGKGVVAAALGVHLALDEVRAV